MFSRRGADPALRVGGAIFASRRTRRANQCQRGAGRVGGGHGYELSRTVAARGPRWGVLGVAVLMVAAGLGFALAPPAGAVTARQAWDGSRAPDVPGRSAVALTFDDGPAPTWTPQVLDVLARHHVRATFFMVGSRAAAYPDLVRRVAAAGHVVEAHTWSHARL